MPLKSTNLGICILLILTLCCELLDPGPSTGTLNITFNNTSADGSLKKSPGELSDVLCIVSKNNSIKRKKLLPKKGDHFQTRIYNLDPGEDYSVLLYGREMRNYYIVVSAQQSGIEIQEGKETTIDMSWSPFTTSLIYPVMGDTINKTGHSDNYVQFIWSSVPGAKKYHIILDDNENFSSAIPITELILRSDWTSTHIYTGLFKKKTYYWKVRCIGLWPLTSTSANEKLSVTDREGPWEISSFAVRN